MTPLWLCCTLESGKERAAHELLMRHFISSLYLTRLVRWRPSRHAKPRTKPVALVPGYAFIAHDGSDLLPSRLLRLTWPASAGAVIHRVLGYCNQSAMQPLIDIAGQPEAEPRPVRFMPGDRVKLLIAQGIEREVQIAVIGKGRKVWVEIDGRRIETTTDRLEAA